MIIGHLPAGYLAARGLSLRYGSRALFLGVIIGAVLPDLDMLWFFLVDQGSHHHHGYLTHRPLVWALILAVGALTRNLAILGLGLGGLLHMLLDTTLGQIAWLWPLSDAAHPLIEVTATHDHWLLSFMTHWTFLIELGLLGLALLVYAGARKPHVKGHETG